jgi:hypothetical protein
VAEAERTVRTAMRDRLPKLCARILDGAQLAETDRATLLTAMREALDAGGKGPVHGDA